MVPMKAFCDRGVKQQPTCRRAIINTNLLPKTIYFIWVLPEAQRCVFTGWFCCNIQGILRGSRGKLQEPVSDLEVPPPHIWESGLFAVVGYRVYSLWGRFVMVLICEFFIMISCLNLCSVESTNILGENVFFSLHVFKKQNISPEAPGPHIHM